MVISLGQPHADRLLSMDAEPLIHMSLCPDKPILAGFLGSFALSNYQRSPVIMMIETLYP
jgi:hypothetical protein